MDPVEVLKATAAIVGGTIGGGLVLILLIGLAMRLLRLIEIRLQYSSLKTPVYYSVLAFYVWIGATLVIWGITMLMVK